MKPFDLRYQSPAGDTIFEQVKLLEMHTPSRTRYVHRGLNFIVYA